MVTGSPPFEAETSQEVVAKHISEPAPDPSVLNARVPAELSGVIVRCLAKRPAERYQSAESLSQALHHVQRGPGPDRSGELPSAPANRAADGVDSERTALLVSAETEPASIGTDAPPTQLTGSGGRSRRLAWVGVGMAAATALALVIFFANRPVLVVENDLSEPIRLSLSGSPERDIEGGDRLTLRVGRRRALIGTWHLVRPATPDGAPMGVEIRGTIYEDLPRGTMRYTARGRADGRAYFAPLITNATGQPLSVTVNAGLQGSTVCGCEIQPGATRAAIGYYELFRNSTVRVRDPTGRTATFVDLGSKVDPKSGRVGLRFESGDLR